MKRTKYYILFLLILLFNGCIVQFIPETNEDQDLMVVEGLITNQPGINTIKLSRSLPLGAKNIAKPMKGCTVRISDNFGHNYNLKETVPGTYVTDPALFTGVVGRFYTLNISTNATYNKLSYRSYPMEMRAVPPIDSIYYEKITLRAPSEDTRAIEGAQIYLNTHDPSDHCKFYRWEYQETWEFRLPYDVPNKVCWLSANSGSINVKSTSALAEDRVNRYPINFVSNVSDRLSVKYSMLINQYSLNEEEFNYWEKLRVIGEQVGGLYDIIPAAIPTNLWCVEEPAEKVLGFFSVSATSSKRIFIKDFFWGVIDLYNDCISDTIPGTRPIPGVNISVWVIEDRTQDIPPFRVITDKRGCADCSVRGTTIKPLFWK